MRKILLAVLLAVLPAIAWPDILEGYVVAVRDGDTLTLKTSGKRIKVRLIEIDAPELKQRFGRASKRSLAELCLHDTATVVSEGKDKYGRTLGHVYCDDSDASPLDANAYQVEQGMAWFYTKYSSNPELKKLESTARHRHVGLWADSDPVPPWDFRRSKSANTGTSTTTPSTPTKTYDTGQKTYYDGPRGGCYYYTSHGTKVYVDHSYCGR
jgi:micrococcal nuclease